MHWIKSQTTADKESKIQLHDQNSGFDTKVIISIIKYDILWKTNSEIKTKWNFIGVNNLLARGTCKEVRKERKASKIYNRCLIRNKPLNDQVALFPNEEATRIQKQSYQSEF